MVNLLAVLAAVFGMATIAALMAWRRAVASNSELESEQARLHQEIAECRSGQRRLGETEDLIDYIIDAVPLPISYIDRDGRYLYANRRYRDWFDFSPQNHLIGSHVGEHIGGELDEDIKSYISKALIGYEISFETQLPVSGDMRPITCTLIPNLNKASEAVGFVILLQDVTERKQRDETLRRTEATTRAILDAAVDGIITIDERGHIASFNRAAERIFGYTASEVAGRNVNVLMPEPYHTAHDGYIRNYTGGGAPRIIGIGREVEGRRKDGSTFPMDLAVGESSLAGRRIFAGIIRDISQRKETEERLRHSEERFRLLVEGVRDYAILHLDTKGRITSWNQGAERIAGWTADEIIGRHFSSFYPSEAIAEGEPERILETVKTQGRFEDEGWHLRKDGSRYWAHVAITPLRDETGLLRGYVSIFRDMTERKHVEEQLRCAKEDAERANLAKSKFLAAASHDLRQPVQALFFFTSALSHKLRESPARDILADIERSLEALNILLDSLLDVSKLDAGVVTPNETTFSVESLMGRMEAEFAPSAASKGLKLRMVPCSAVIRSDPALLSRILQNLVTNAVRYTQQGRVLIGCRHHGDMLRIEVWDTGIGIPKERFNDIFEEFYQVGNSERDRTQGLGLGLAIVNRLAKLLNHRIEVKSWPGKGSLFAVEVPLENSRPVPLVRRKTVDTVIKTSKKLIVIIDDEATVLRGLCLVLEDWGFEVLAAGSEDEAMQLLSQRTETPNAIVADYRLREGRTGTEAIRHIRDLFNSPIPSIIITGDTAPERLREAEASGFSILHKPVQPPQLHTLLAHTLHIH